MYVHDDEDGDEDDGHAFRSQLKATPPQPNNDDRRLYAEVLQATRLSEQHGRPLPR
jgi:hypothetical protein